MNRDYESGKSDSAIYFVGTEIENSHFKGRSTLFVTGLQDSLEVLEKAEAHVCNHVYLGANHSFRVPYEPEFFSRLNTQVRGLINNYLNVTIDVPHQLIAGLDDDIVGSPYVCVMCSVCIPDADRIKNLAMKIDDMDFNFSNSKVWVAKREEFTATEWSEYSNDSIV